MKMKMKKRVDKVNYYLDIAEFVAERSTCLSKKYGAVIVNNDEIISTGYNGSPRGCINCIDEGECSKDKNGKKRGQGYEFCMSVHVEQNAIISASRKDMINGEIYIAGIEYETGNYVENIEPCSLCKRFIINSGLEDVYVRLSKVNFKLFLVDKWKIDKGSILGVY